MVLTVAGDQQVSRSGLLPLRSLLVGRMLLARTGAWPSEPAERAKRRIPPRREGGWDLVPLRWRLGSDGLQFATTPTAEDPGRGDGGARQFVAAAEETEHSHHGGSLRFGHHGWSMPTGTHETGRARPRPTMMPGHRRHPERPEPNRERAARTPDVP